MGLPQFENISDNTDTFTWPKAQRQPSAPVDAKRDQLHLEILIQQSSGQFVSVTKQETLHVFDCEWLVGQVDKEGFRHFWALGRFYLYPDSDLAEKLTVSWMEAQFNAQRLPGGDYLIRATLAEGL